MGAWRKQPPDSYQDALDPGGDEGITLGAKAHESTAPFATPKLRRSLRRRRFNPPAALRVPFLVPCTVERVGRNAPGRTRTCDLRFRRPKVCEAQPLPPAFSVALRPHSRRCTRFLPAVCPLVTRILPGAEGAKLRAQPRKGGVHGAKEGAGFCQKLGCLTRSPPRRPPPWPDRCRDHFTALRTALSATFAARHSELRRVAN